MTNNHKNYKTKVKQKQKLEKDQLLVAIKFLTVAFYGMTIYTNIYIDGFANTYNVKYHLMINNLLHFFYGHNQTH